MKRDLKNGNFQRNETKQKSEETKLTEEGEESKREQFQRTKVRERRKHTT